MLEKMKPAKNCGNIFIVVTILCFIAASLSFHNRVPFPSIFRTRTQRNQAPALCHTPRTSLIPGSTAENSTIGNSSDHLLRALIDDFRARTRVAAASLKGKQRDWDGSLSQEQVAKWERKNPCRSRTELAPMYSLRKHAKNLPPNALWEEVFQEYSKYHRVCMTAVGDLAKYFNERKTHTGCQFVVADTGDTIGIGNRLQVVANSVLYGIITRRVILVPTTHDVTKSICEPIVGSTWVLDANTFPTPPDRHGDKWTLSSDVFRAIDQNQRNGIYPLQQIDCNTTVPNPPEPQPKPENLPYAAGDITNRKQPYQRFYCPTEQSFYSEITWVYLAGCLYTIPKTFAVPIFRPTLEALFPDRVILTRLLRSFVFPIDPIWTRVRRLRDTYLQPGDRRVGIQMRYVLGADQFHRMHDLINKRLVNCVLSNGILPQLSDGNPTKKDETSSNSTRISVLVTSLYQTLHDKLKDMYIESPTVDGSLVTVVQLTHKNRQDYGVVVDWQAYTEILLLSLSDDLLIAPISTFGGSAQAYGALSPWLVEYRDDERLDSCARSQSVEVCNQYTGLKFDCQYDEELGTKPFAEIVPGMENCPQIEFPYHSENEQGVRIRTTFLS